MLMMWMRRRDLLMHGHVGAATMMDPLYFFTVTNHHHSTMMICSPSVARSVLLSVLLLLGTTSQNAIASSSSLEDISMGTTILAMKYKDGVIVAADSRTSAGTYVSNKMAHKLNVILNGNGSGKTSCVIGRSGSAADTQWLAMQAKYEFTHRARRQLLPTVSQVAHYLKYCIRNSRESLQASLICAGYDGNDENDDDHSMPRIYSIAPNGSLLEEDVFCVSGSGSTFILGHLDHELREGSDHLEEADAIAMVTRMLQLSIHRDGSSGGLIRIIVMNHKDGLKELVVYPESPPLSTTTKHADDNLSSFAKATPVLPKAFGGVSTI